MDLRVEWPAIVISGLLSQHFRKNLLPGRSDLSGSSISRIISNHLRLKRPSEEDALTYNVLQRLAYLTVVFLVLCRNLTEPTILAGFDFLPDRSPAAVVAVEMWEPALYAGFQAPGTGRPSGWELPRFSPRRVISMANP